MEMVLEHELERFREEIRSVLDRVAEIGDEALGEELLVTLDEVFVLRYLLSCDGDVDKAVERIEQTLEWRRANIDALKQQEIPRQEQVTRFLLTGFSGQLKSGEPLCVVRIGLSDCKSLMDNVSVEDLADFMTFEKERLYRMCDKETRRTGKLVKAITIIDFEGFSLFSSQFDKRVINALGASSKASSVYFPQLQLKMVAVNTPSGVGIVTNLLKAVMPKSSMDKMVMCSQKKPMQGQSAADTCPFCQTLPGIAEALPDFLGGAMEKVPPYLLPLEKRPRVVSEDESDDVQVFPENGLFETAVVSPRSSTLVELIVPDDSIDVNFEVSVDKSNITMSAKVVPDDSSDSSDDSDHSEEQLPQQKATHRRGRSRSVDILKEITPKALKKHFFHPSRKTRAESDPNAGNTTQEHYDSDAEDNGKLVVVQKRRQRRGSSHTLKSNEDLQLESVMTPIRVSPKNGIVKGHWNVPVSGKVCFEFRNNSKIRTKKVQFRFSLAKKKPANHHNQNNNFISIPATVEALSMIQKIPDLTRSISQILNLPYVKTVLSLFLVVIFQYQLLLITFF